MNISKQTAPPPPRCTGQMMQGVHARPAQGRGQLGHEGKCVLCESEQARFHCTFVLLRHISIRQEAREQRGVHLSLFDGMFNDRLTKGLQMRAGVISPPPPAFHRSASVLIAHRLITKLISLEPQ